MTAWGVGPKIACATVPYALVMILLHIRFYPDSVISPVPYAAFISCGIALILLGFPVWLSSAMKIDAFFQKRVLATKGIYGIMRNPVYAGSFFVHLGIVLLFRSWFLITIPIVFYISFRFLILSEEAYLERMFGEEFTAYKRRIHALLPTPGRIYEAFFYPAPVGMIQENLYAVKSRDVNLFIYRAGADAVCIDAGYGDDATAEGLDMIGIEAGSISHLFLTHGDSDHTGGLHHFPAARVFLGKDEKEMIDGTRPRIAGIYRSPRLREGYSLIDDGDIISVGSITVRAIATPGHTPGHMAYLVNDRILFTGDAIIVQNGGVAPFYRPFNMDHAAAVASARRLSGLEGITIMCTAHTGYTRRSDEPFREWKSGQGIPDDLMRQYRSVRPEPPADADASLPE
ncbi:MAG: MBL fold metallo-hydrolase [Spirochaetes bacterium]|nr:MBL fold metallo-hydrolase [Spirochaetota bacterium]